VLSELNAPPGVLDGRTQQQIHNLRKIKDTTVAMNLEIIPQLSTACSSPFQPAAQLYQQHNPAEAYALAMKVFRDPDCDWSALTENDWLLLSALCKASGESRRHTAMHKLGFQHRPQSKLLGAMYAWDLSASRRYFEARDLLEKLAADADESYSTLVVAVQTYNYSDMGWKDTAAEYHERVIGQAADNPMSLYVLARAAARRRQWSDAPKEYTNWHRHGLALILA